MRRLLLLSIGFILNFEALSYSGVPIFPGAQGFGTETKAGRGGRVLIVSNLNDSGPGSFRDAVNATGNRVILFRVGGLIRLNSTVEIKNPNISIAGQSAPSPGITLAMNRGSKGPLMGIYSHDVLVRFLKLRRGDTGFHGDSLSIADESENVVVDHCSITWATDENLEIYSDLGKPIKNVTLSSNIIAQGIAEPVSSYPEGHPLGALISTHPDSWNKKLLSNISVHHNLFAHNAHRNPRVLASNSEVIGNIVFNWKTRAMDFIGNSEVDIIGNYFKRGEHSQYKTPLANPRLIFYESTTSDLKTKLPPASLFIDNNTTANIAEAFATPMQRDNWRMIVDHYLPNQPLLPIGMRRMSRLSSSLYPVSPTYPNAKNEKLFLSKVGANARLDCNGNWVFDLDRIDARVTESVIRSESVLGTLTFPHSSIAAGGYLAQTGQSNCIDSDLDGIPDSFERHKGYDPQKNDSALIDSESGYSRLELYLNGPSSQ